MRRGQITLFILIGFILLGTFVFINQVNNTLQTAQLEAQAKTTIQEAINTNAVQFFVEACLTEVGQQGLFLAAAQGGNIYTSQNGSHIPISYGPDKSKSAPCSLAKNFSRCRVGYGIQEPTLSNGTNTPPPPFWPGERQSPLLDFNDWGFFGEATIRPICYLNGSNRFGINNDFRNPFCLGKTYGFEESTQYVFEEFIQREIKKCVNEDIFKNLSYTRQFNFTFKDPNASLIYGESNTRLDLEYPVEFSFAGSIPVTTFINFGVTFPVRFKKLGELASLISVYDSSRLNFDARSNYTNFRSVWDSRMNVSFSQPYRNQSNFDDLVVITDEGSRLFGRFLSFQFLRQNRHPTLDLIRQEGAVDPYDIVVLEGDNILLDPNPKPEVLYDPDEDNITYFYYGWLETRNETFSPRDGIQVLPGTPRIWTNSQKYTQTKRSANYTTKRKDIGPHNITVYACDEYIKKNELGLGSIFGINEPSAVTENDKKVFENIYLSPLCDWQVIRILVSDIPQLNLTGFNDYDDINNSYASVEDFYNFNWAGTFAYFTSFSKIILSIPYENEGGEDLVFLEDYSPESTDTVKRVPENIRDIFLMRGTRPFQFRYFDELVDEFGQTFLVGDHQVSLETNIPGPKVYQNITVYDCLPHRSDEPSLNFRTINQPYDIDEAIKYNHTCCLGNGPSPDVFRKDFFNVKANKCPTSEDTYTFPGITADQQELFGQVSNLNPAKVKVFKRDFTPKEGSNKGTCSWYYHALDASDSIIVDDLWGTPANTLTSCYIGGEKTGSVSAVLGGTSSTSRKIIFTAGSQRTEIEGDIITGLKTNGVISYLNDVWKKAEKQFCKGNQGNICGGDVLLELEQGAKCDSPEDFTTGQILSCQGAIGTNTSCSMLSWPKVWEKEFGLNRANNGENINLNYSRTNLDLEDGYTCNPTTVCSNTPSGTYTYNSNSDGRYVAVGGCNSGNCNLVVPTKDCWSNNVYEKQVVHNAAANSATKVTLVECSATQDDCVSASPALKDLDGSGGPGGNQEFLCKHANFDWDTSGPGGPNKQTSCWGDDGWEGTSSNVPRDVVKFVDSASPDKYVLKKSGRDGEFGCEGPASNYVDNLNSNFALMEKGPGGSYCCGEDNTRSSTQVGGFKCTVPGSYSGYEDESISEVDGKTIQTVDKNGVPAAYSGGEWTCDSTDYSASLADISATNSFYKTHVLNGGLNEQTFDSGNGPFCIGYDFNSAGSLIRFERGTTGSSGKEKYTLEVDFDDYLGDCEPSKYAIFNPNPVNSIADSGSGSKEFLLDKNNNYFAIGFSAELGVKSCIVENLKVTRLEYCGDGLIEGGESCDDGNSVDADSCKNDCTLPPPPAP